MENAGFKQQLIAFLQLDSYGDEKIEELDIEMARTVCKNLNCKFSINQSLNLLSRRSFSNPSLSGINTNQNNPKIST
jgi:hypothetical protein